MSKPQVINSFQLLKHPLTLLVQAIFGSMFQSPKHNAKVILCPLLLDSTLNPESLPSALMKNNSTHMFRYVSVVLEDAPNVFSKFLLKTNQIQFSSVAQQCPALCDTRNYSTPGFPDHHQLLKLGSYVFCDTYCTFPCLTLLDLPFVASQDLNLIMSSEAMRDEWDSY